MRTLKTLHVLINPKKLNENLVKTMSIEYILQPEVSGELGEKSELKTEVFPPQIIKLHFIFKTWLGDDLIECFPVYLVSERLKKAIEESNIEGYYFSDFEQSSDESMSKLQSISSAPVFFWFNFEKGNKDFHINDNNQLVVSERVFKLLKEFNLNYCDIEKREE